MPDGPNYEKLFTETDCLTAQSNLKEICQFLRFFKNEGAYQTYLQKFLPKLAKPEYKEAFDEFIGDLKDEGLAKELKESLKPEKVKVEVVPAETSTDVPVAVVEKPKRGRKTKAK